MSINAKCTITVSNEEYEAGTEHEIVFSVTKNASSTGVFSGMPGAFIRSVVEGSANLATEEALRKLKAMKGDILFDHERTPKPQTKKVS